jgi:hypothetical protein
VGQLFTEIERKQNVTDISAVDKGDVFSRDQILIQWENPVTVLCFTAFSDYGNITVYLSGGYFRQA